MNWARASGTMAAPAVATAAPPADPVLVMGAPRVGEWGPERHVPAAAPRVASSGRDEETGGARQRRSVDARRRGAVLHPGDRDPRRGLPGGPRACRRGMRGADPEEVRRRPRA